MLYLDASALSDAAESRRPALIRRAVDEYLTQEERDTASWRTQWKKAVQETAGIAPISRRAPEYVESLRRRDSERLSGLER